MRRELYLPLTILFNFIAQAEDRRLETSLEIITNASNEIQKIINTTPIACGPQDFNENRKRYCQKRINQNPLEDIFRAQAKELFPYIEDAHKILNCGEDSTPKDKDKWFDGYKQLTSKLVEVCQQEEKSEKSKEDDKLENFKDRSELLQSYYDTIDSNILADDFVLAGIEIGDFEKMVPIVTQETTFDGEPKGLLTIFNNGSQKIKDNILKLDMTYKEIEKRSSAQDITDESNSYFEDLNNFRIDFFSSNDQMRNAVITDFLRAFSPALLPYNEDTDSDFIINNMERAFKQQMGIDIHEFAEGQSKEILTSAIEDIQKNKGYNLAIVSWSITDNTQYNQKSILNRSKPPKTPIISVSPNGEIKVDEYKVDLEENQNSPQGHPPVFDPLIANNLGRMIASYPLSNAIANTLMEDPEPYLEMMDKEASLYNELEDQWIDETLDSQDEFLAEVDKRRVERGLKCKNLSQKCTNVYETQLSNMASIRYTGDFYSDKKNQKRKENLVNAGKDAMYKFIESSKFSDQSKKEINNHVKDLKIIPSKLSTDHSKNCIKTLGETYKWTRDNNPELEFEKVQLITSNAILAQQQDLSMDTALEEFGVNAYYDPKEKGVQMLTGFLNDQVVKNNKASIMGVVFHELGHAIDPIFNPDFKKKQSTSSLETRNNVGECLKEKFFLGEQREKENFADLVANEIFYSVVANAKENESYYLDELDRAHLLKDYISSSCEKYNSILDSHSSDKERSDQFLSHGDFNKLFPTVDQPELDHGDNCAKALK